jgi:hypothetical protein
MDGCSNSATPVTVIYTWTVNTNAPVITSVPSGTNLNLGCNPATLPTDASVAAQVAVTDNCTMQSTNVSHVDGGSACAMTRTFTITATDGCGNISTPQTVVYTWTMDTNAPVLTVVPPGGYLGCNPTNLPTTASVAAQVVAADNCTVQSTNVSSVTTTNGSTFTSTFTVTATDECGNTSAPQTVVYSWIIDTSAPVLTFVPTGGYLGCNPTNFPTAASVAAQVVATANCAMQSTNVSSVLTTNGSTITSTFTVSTTDVCGFTSAPQTVVYSWIIDTSAPVLTFVPTGGNMGCNPTNLPTDASVAAQVVAAANCAMQSTNVSHLDGGSDCAMTRTFTITATDVCGFTSLPQTVVYTWTNDTNAPVITSVPAGGYLGQNPAILPVITNVAAQVTATDDCTLASTNISFVDSGSPTAVTRTFTITVADACGNTSAPQTVIYFWQIYTNNPVIVITTNPPVITQLPPGGNLGCNPALLPTDASVTAQVVVTNGSCALQSTNVSHVDGGSDCAMTRTFTITATDTCGNTSAPQTVAYSWTIDTTAPVVTNLPAGGYLGCNPATLPTSTNATAQIIVTDNCSVQSTNVTCLTTTNGSTITRTFTVTATDECGNTSAPQTVVYTWIINSAAPVITHVPTGGSLGCNPTNLPTTASVAAQVVATDNCTVQSTNVTCLTATNGSTITRTFTITATDVCGFTSAPQTVVYTWIVDTSVPVITHVPAGGSLGCNPTNLPTTASVAAQVVATANCNLQSTNVTCLTATNGSTITRTFTITATDQCGNISAPSTVVYTWIIDTTAPVITHVPAGGSLGCNPTNLPTTASVAAQVVATTSCSLQSTNVTCLTATNGSTITRTFTITATDACGYTSAPSTVVYTWIVDTTAPVITHVPAGGSLGCNPTNLPTTASVAAQVVATTSCSLQSTNVSYLTTTNGSTITRTFTITATDACGYTSAPSTVVYTWTIDTTAPVITHVPTGGSLGCNPTNLPTTASVAAQVVATTSCSLQSTNVSYLTTTNGSTITRTFTITATDACGYTSAPQTVVYTWIVDTTAPVITHVPTGGNLGCNPASLPTVASVAAQVVATDNCTVQSTNVADVDSTNDCTVTRTFTIGVTDECGNASAPATVVYTWTADTTPPVVTCPPAITLSNGVVPYCTFTPGDYGAACNGTNAASILTNCFSKVFTNGWLQCGITNSSGYCLKFTTCNSVQKFVPCGGNPGCLKASYSNPTTCEAGVFAGQTLCLDLNVSFGDAKSVTGFSAGCGDLVLNDCTSPLNGLSVRQILGVCHTALGGGNISSYGCTISNLSTTCSNLNQSFENCTPSAWCANHLVPATITNVPPSVSGTATVADKCSSTPTLTYSDVITAGTCPQTYVIARTWVAVDGCGNSNSCTQNIYIGDSQASVCGNVFMDCNGDGLLTPGIDSGMPGVAVLLKNASNVTVATNTTDSQGSYCFYDLTPGTYSVHIIQPTNTLQTAGTCANHWLNSNGQQCWIDNDNYQHCKGVNSVDSWTSSDGCQHWKNSNNQDCWTDKYGNSHTQACTYVSCDLPTNNAETFTLAPCQALTGVNFAYQGILAKPVVSVTGPSKGVCGHTGTYTCCVTNAGTACFAACQVTACGNSYSCPSLSPGQGCSFQFNYNYQYGDAGNFNCQATAKCTTYSNYPNNPNSTSSCTGQGTCSTSVGYY